MSDVTLNSKEQIGPLGPYYLTKFKITGDNSATTLPTKITDKIIAVWAGNESNTAAQIISFAAATGIVTWGTAPSSAGVSHLFVLHKP